KMLRSFLSIMALTLLDPQTAAHGQRPRGLKGRYLTLSGRRLSLALGYGFHRLRCPQDGSFSGGSRFLRGHGTNQQRWVHAFIEPVHPPVQMGTGGTAAGAHLCNNLPLLNAIPFRHEDFMEVDKCGGQAVSVIYDQGSPREEHVRMHQRDHPSCRRLYRRARWGCNVYPVMGRVGFAVVKPLAAIHTSDTPHQWPFEFL